MALNAEADSNLPRMPVVLVSHGTGGTGASLGWLCRGLAQNGFAVFATDHHGNNGLEPYRAEGFLCWWERARDLSVLLDSMVADGFCANRLDVDRVYAVGFSLGSHTALSLAGGVSDMNRFGQWAKQAGGPFARGPREFPNLADELPRLLETRVPLQESWRRRDISYRDHRVQAALLLAPAPPVRSFTDESLAGINLSVHMMNGGADIDAPAEVGMEWLAERLPKATMEYLGPSVGHYVFLPECTAEGRNDAPGLCADAAGVDRHAVHVATITAAIQLFR